MLAGLLCHTDGAVFQANTSGIMFDIEESVPLWDNSVRPHKMVAGAPEYVHNFTRDMLRPLVREGALRIIMLGDERMCSGVPSEDVQAVAAAVQSALNSSVQDRFGAWWPGLPQLAHLGSPRRRSLSARLRSRSRSAAAVSAAVGCGGGGGGCVALAAVARLPD